MCFMVTIKGERRKQHRHRKARPTEPGLSASEDRSWDDIGLPLLSPSAFSYMSNVKEARRLGVGAEGTGRLGM